MSVMTQQAQIELMKAQANKFNKEANVIGTTGVEEAYARIKYQVEIYLCYLKQI